MYDTTQLQPYTGIHADLVPVYPWNKLLMGEQIGKHPIGDNWMARSHKPGDVAKWIAKGYNIGYRIPENEVVVDFDPRNYDFDDSADVFAKLVGYADFDSLTFDVPTVRTGGGGWHLYYRLPEGVDCRTLKETVDELAGVEFKRRGRQVLIAGSKHPDGGMYVWENPIHSELPLPTLNGEVLKLITRRTKKRFGDYVSGKGALNGSQLGAMVLAKLDVTAYGAYDSWFPIMAACHHATNGDGIDQFVTWSLGDFQYDSDEHQIRLMWEKLWDKENSITIATLIHELDKAGEDSVTVRAALDFQSSVDSGNFADEEETEEAKVMLDAEMVASQIDLGDLLEDPTIDDDDAVSGRALAFAKTIQLGSDDDEVLKAIRLIKVANPLEAERAIECLVSRKIIGKVGINKLLKQLDTKFSDDLGTILNKKTLEIVFNNGKHLLCCPNGALFMFYKTHWKPVSDEFLGKISRKTLAILKKKIDIDSPELNLINQSVSLCRIDSSTLTDRIYDPSRPLLPLVNCVNGELMISLDGSHKLRPHNYRSYQTGVLTVAYDPGAECPLFLSTINEIFSQYSDRDDMVRHMMELMGYLIQPVKNIASFWLFRGPGGDGKSTLIKILAGVLGSSILFTTVRLLRACTTAGDPHALTSLISQLCVVIEELPVKTKLNDEAVKLLSEKTEMTANPKHVGEIKFIYQGNLIMCSNGYPRVDDLSEGMMRRARVIPFNMQFDAKGIADVNRADDILTNPKEMSGVLNLMLEGLQRLRDRGTFLDPASCKAAKETWLGESNNVYRFIAERVAITKEIDDKIGDYQGFYEFEYMAWCQLNGIEDKMRKGKIQLRRELESLGLVFRNLHGNVLSLLGGRLIETDELDDFDEL